jgi:hypothetical protein
VSKRLAKATTRTAAGCCCGLRGASASWVLRYTGPTGRREMGLGIVLRGSPKQAGDSLTGARDSRPQGRDLLRQRLDPSASATSTAIPPARSRPPRRRRRPATTGRCAVPRGITTHGFAILNQLRGYFPGAASFLMDRVTLLAHRLHWGEEPAPARHDLSRLTPEEAAVYDELRFDRHQTRLRLEQERVGFTWLCDRLACIPSGALVSPPHCL